MPPIWSSTIGIQQLRANSGAKLGSLNASWGLATTASGLVAYRMYIREGALAPNIFGLTSSYFLAEVYATSFDIYQSAPIQKLKAGTTYSVIVRAVDDAHSEDTNVVSLSKMVPVAAPALTNNDTNDTFPYVPHYEFTEDWFYRTHVTQFESGKEQRRGVWQSPLRRFTVKLNPFHKDDVSTLWQFFVDHKGALKSWLFDADINSAEVHEQIDAYGVGMTYSGVLTSPLVKRGTFRGLVGVTQSIVDAAGGLTGSTLVSGTIDYETGQYSFVLASPPATTISCFYQQQYRCRFEEDVLSRELFGYKLYNIGLGIIQVK